jgi:signal transduction histidine kinase
MVFIAAVEKFNAEYLDTVNPLWWGGINEDIFTSMIALGFGISVVGFYFLLKHIWQQERQRDQQHKIIELYTSLMTHDAGNDLQAILGYIEAALLVPEGCSPKATELLEAAQAAALRMTSLIRAFKPKTSDSGSQLISILEVSSHQAVKAHIGLTIDIEADDGIERIEVVGSSMLQMAFANLFRNAAQYAGDNPSVKIRVSKEDSNAIIIVSDDGPGIGSNFRESLFQRGGSGEDHGFGLYLAKQIVAACEGGLELLDSDKGATFKITLPYLE